MTDTVIATRATISIGPLSVDGFMLPDGSYRMSQADVARAVDLGRQSLSDFLRSKAIKSLLGDGFGSQKFEKISIQSEGQREGRRNFNATPLEVVSAYWLWQSSRGNKKALALSMALIIESLERRFDDVFGVEMPDSQRNEILSARIGRLNQDLEKLGEAYAVEDDVRRENEELWFYIREQGLPGPYKLEDGD